MNIDQLKQQGEIASEQGDQEQALIKFDQAFILAMKQKNYAEAINLLGHHLHIYKVYFQQTQDPNFMELFYADVLTGLRLAEFNQIDGQPKSVMLLRAGDYFLFKHDYVAAAQQLESAVIELAKDKTTAPETKAEYLGHYAIALVKSGDDSGWNKFQEALQTIQHNHTIRPFHHLIIESGILLRYADACLFSGQMEQAKRYLSQAQPLVEELANAHKMPMRQQQAAQLAAAIADAQKN